MALDTRLVLREGQEGLELQNPFGGPIRVDFVHGPLGYRARQGLSKKDNLARAMGVEKDIQTVIDATSGLGSDSLSLNLLGFEVWSVEQSPEVFALLKDGWERGKIAIQENREPIALSGLEKFLARSKERRRGCRPSRNQVSKPKRQKSRVCWDKWHLVEADSARWLRSLDWRPDAVFLDPMFPELDRSAAQGKEMRALVELLGPGRDDKLLELWQAAMTVSRKRVVLKRPRAIGGHASLPMPTMAIVGKTIAYDVWVL